MSGITERVLRILADQLEEEDPRYRWEPVTTRADRQADRDATAAPAVTDHPPTPRVPARWRAA